MEIRLNVYGDCTSEKPSKTYTVRRILFKTAKELTLIQAETTDAKDDTEVMLRMLQTVLPDFDESDLDGLDLLEVREFFQQVGAEINAVVARAQKN